MATASGGQARKCPLCLTSCDRQRLLICCLHSFCEKCIVSIARNYIDSKRPCKCPVCNTPFKGPDDFKNTLEWSLSLPLNRFLTNQDVKEQRNMLRSCQPCGFRGASFKASRFCITCDEAHCQDCSNIHQSSRWSRNHHCVDIDDAEKSVPKYPVDVDMLMTCSKHTEKHVEFFCEIHDVFVCSKCAIKEHRECQDLHDISHAADPCMNQDLTGDLREGMQQVVAHLEILCRTAQDACNKFDKDVCDFKTTMKTVRKNVNTVFDKYEKECDEKISNARKRQKQNLETLQKEKNRHEVATENSLQLFDTVRRHGNTYQIYYYGQYLERQISAYEQRVESNVHPVLSMNLKTVIFKKTKSIIEGKTVGSMEIIPEENELPKTDFRWPKLRFTNNTPTKEAVNDGKAIIDSEDVDCRVENASVNPLEGNSCNSRKGALKVGMKSFSIEMKQNPSSTIFISGITFMKDGRIVMTDVRKRKLFLIKLTLIQSETTLCDKPVDMVAFSATKLAVTVQNKLKILVVEVANRISPLWAVDTYYLPDGISLLSDKTVIVSTRTCVNETDSCFKTVAMPGGKTVGEVTFDNVRVGKHFAVDSTGTRIVTTSSETDELLCLGMQGGRIFSYKISGPTGVDVDKYGHVYVVSETKHEIHIVSQVGRCIKVIDCDTSLRPNRLTMNSGREKFAVTFHDSPRVSVFDINP